MSIAYFPKLYEDELVYSVLKVYDFKQVRINVEEYFKKHLPQYTVLEIRQKSEYPEDSYLFMVSAIKDENSGCMAGVLVVR